MQKFTILLLFGLLLSLLMTNFAKSGLEDLIRVWVVMTLFSLIIYAFAAFIYRVGSGVQHIMGGIHSANRFGFTSILCGVVGQLLGFSADITIFLINNGIIFRAGGFIENCVFVFGLLVFPVNILGIGFGVTAIIKSTVRQNGRASVVIIVAIVGILLNSFIYIGVITRPTAESLHNIREIEEKARKGDTKALAQLQKIVKERLPWYPRVAGTLGEIYENGQGVPKDYDEALRWYLRGNHNDVFRACEMYEKGQGIPQDFVKAARCYRKVIFLHTFPVAEYRLGKMYEKGLGVGRDHAKAQMWFDSVASTAYSSGTYHADKGDKVKAYKWFTIAVALGENRAEQRLSLLAGNMTEEEMLRAKAGASSWLNHEVVPE